MHLEDRLPCVKVPTYLQVLPREVASLRVIAHKARLEASRTSVRIRFEQTCGTGPAETEKLYIFYRISISVNTTNDGLSDSLMGQQHNLEDHDPRRPHSDCSVVIEQAD